ncbi:MAG: hypothetical protein E3K37_09105 [Candidatus Kuenenia sp.]|nr:hypothetical protein [Candidatus Kuenenia hertensis]
MSDEAPKGQETPGWLLTYGDMVTLLVTFFVMLISLSTINVDKYKEVMKQVQASMGGDHVLEGSKKPFDTEAEPGIDITEMNFPPIKIQEQIETEKFVDDKEWYQYLSDYVTKTELKNYVELEELKIGYVVKIPMDICFERGESILTWEANNIFKKLSYALGMMRGKIIVDTNVEGIEWQRIIAQRNLLIDRAESICNYLLTFEEIDPSRIALSGKRINEISGTDKIAIVVLKKMV